MKLSSALYVINTIKGIVPIEVLRTNTIWGSSYNIHINKIKCNAKRKCAGYRCADYNAHAAPFLNEVCILDLHNLYIYELAKLMYNYEYSKLSQKLLNTPHGMQLTIDEVQPDWLQLNRAFSL